MKSKPFLLMLVIACVVLISSCDVITKFFVEPTVSYVPAEQSLTWQFESVSIGDLFVSHGFDDVQPVTFINLSFATEDDDTFTYESDECIVNEDSEGKAIHTCRFEDPELPFEFITQGAYSFLTLRWSYRRDVSTVYEIDNP